MSETPTPYGTPEWRPKSGLVLALVAHFRKLDPRAQGATDESVAAEIRRLLALDMPGGEAMHAAATELTELFMPGIAPPTLTEITAVLARHWPAPPAGAT